MIIVPATSNRYNQLNFQMAFSYFTWKIISIGCSQMVIHTIHFESCIFFLSMYDLLLDTRDEKYMRCSLNIYFTFCIAFCDLIVTLTKDDKFTSFRSSCRTSKKLFFMFIVTKPVNIIDICTIDYNNLK